MEMEAKITKIMLRSIFCLFLVSLLPIIEPILLSTISIKMSEYTRKHLLSTLPVATGGVAI